jgi:uncharacterized membrane protein
MQAYLTIILQALNWAPGLKTKAAAVAAFLLAIVAAWNSLAPALGVDFVIQVPDFINAAVLALLGVGAANQPANLPPKQ